MVDYGFGCDQNPYQNNSQHSNNSNMPRIKSKSCNFLTPYNQGNPQQIAPFGSIFPQQMFPPFFQQMYPFMCPPRYYDQKGTKINLIKKQYVFNGRRNKKSCKTKYFDSDSDSEGDVSNSDDGYGDRDSYHGLKSVEFVYSPPYGKNVSNVKISGSFDGWEKQYNMRRRGGEWIYKRKLPKGDYSYKFIVDGEWELDENEEKETHYIYTNNMKHVY